MTQVFITRIWPLGIAFLFVCICSFIYVLIRKKNIGRCSFYIKEFSFGYTPLYSVYKIIFNTILILAMILLLLSSMGVTIQKVENRVHVDDSILFLIDISPSMSISDIEEKSRIDVVIKQFSSFLDFISGSSIGVVIFADTVRMIVPFSKDYINIKNILSSVEIGLLGNGSAISDAMLYAINVFSIVQSSRKKLIVITDGLQNSGQSSIKDLKQYKSSFTFPIVFGHIGSQQGGLFKYKDFTTQKIVSGYVEGKGTSVLKDIGKTLDIDQYNLKKERAIRDFFHSLAIEDPSFKIIQQNTILTDFTNIFLFIFYILSLLACSMKLTILRRC